MAECGALIQIKGGLKGSEHLEYDGQFPMLVRFDGPNVSHLASPRSLRSYMRLVAGSWRYQRAGAGRASQDAGAQTVANSARAADGTNDY